MEVNHNVIQRPACLLVSVAFCHLTLHGLLLIMTEVIPEKMKDLLVV